MQCLFILLTIIMSFSIVERHLAASGKIMTLISENITLHLWPRENDLGLFV